MNCFLRTTTAPSSAGNKGERLTKREGAKVTETGRKLEEEKKEKLERERERAGRDTVLSLTERQIEMHRYSATFNTF